MRLKDLVDPALRAHVRGDVDITGLTADSREVKPGYLFAALPGRRHDGMAFIESALANGAAAVLTERPPPWPLPDHVAVIRVDNARRALALAAARFHPRQPAVVVAVTGTAGKTSVAHFTRQIWTRLGRRAAYLGTLGVVAPDGAAYGSLTTPDPVALHRLVDRLGGEGVTHLAVEASSHGLDQHRLDGLVLRAAAFTNLGRDHLDYHPDMAAYLAAKLRLFGELLPGGATVVCPAETEGAAGVPEVLALARRRGLRLLTTAVGTDLGSLPAAALRATVAAHDLRQRLRFDPPFGGCREVDLPLAGVFQASNALIAAGLAVAGGEDAGAVAAALSHLSGVPGRLELVARPRGAGVFIDYAHKPEALAAALAALRPFVAPGGRLIVLFGAGGDRDPGKRPLMGRIAAAAADMVVVTDDNPRSEKPGAIRAAILAAAPGAVEIADRGEAVSWAVGQLRPGDVLLIAGKGHETGQIVGDRVIAFSDHDAVRQAVDGVVAHG